MMTSARSEARVPQGLLLGGVLLTALLLRLPFLGEMSLWLDEIWSIGTARMPWHSMLWAVLHQDSNMSLYYALLHIWQRLGDSAASVRMLSVLAGVATFPVLCALGNRLFSRPVGLVAALLLTVSSFHIEFSQQARGYSLVVLLTTLSSLYFVKSIERPEGKNWLAYVLTSILAVYAHVFAVLVVAAQLASVLFLPSRQVPWKKLMASSVSIGLFGLPLIFLLFGRIHEPGAPISWAPKPNFHMVSDLYYALSGGTQLSRAAYALSGLFVVFGVIQLLRSSGRSVEAWKPIFMLCWTFLPVAIVLVVSMVKPTFAKRYFLICLPPLLLLVAQWVCALKPRGVAAVAFAAVVAFPSLGLDSYYQARSLDQHWQKTTDFILTHALPEDAMVFYVAPGRLAFDYYRRDNPEIGGEWEFLYPDFKDAMDPDALWYSPALRKESFENRSAQKHRVWLVLYHNEFVPIESGMSRQFQESLSATHRKILERKFGAPAPETVTVMLYSNSPSDQPNAIDKFNP